MKEFIFGIISGIVSALGMGGGTILILLLNLFTKINQHTIQGINLFFFIPTSIIAIYMNYKNKIIDYKSSLFIIFFGIIGAILGAKISFYIDNNRLKKYFGIFLLFIATFQIYTIIRQYIKNKKDNNIIIKDK